MKIEYLLIKSNNDFCKTIEQFEGLLSSNCRLELDGNNIKFSNMTLSYSLTQSDVEWRNKREVVFYLCVSIDGDNSKTEAYLSEDNDDITNIEAHTLEEFDNLLHRINENYGNQFRINIIWDDVSMFYAQKLYPQIIESENLLRKVIYRFMIKIAGSSWFGDTAPNTVKDALAKTAEKNNMEDIPQENQLYLADFIQLGRFFFEKYTTSPFGQGVIIELKKLLYDEDCKNKLNSLIETYEAKSNWDRYFAEKIQIDGLYEKWQRLYSYRNKVAHTKGINGEDYECAQKLINELMEAFLKCLDHIDDVEITEDEVGVVQKVAEETIRNIKHATTSYSDDLILGYSGINSLSSQLGFLTSEIGSQIKSTGLNSTKYQLANLPSYYAGNGVFDRDLILDNKIGDNGWAKSWLNLDDLVENTGVNYSLGSKFSSLGGAYINASNQSILSKAIEASDIITNIDDDSGVSDDDSDDCKQQNNK